MAKGSDSLSRLRLARISITRARSPYIMFDSKTAQACWARPSNAPNDKDFWAQYSNSAKIPFCKDLK